MTNPADTPKRIAFVLGALTGKELSAGNQDVSHVYWLLTNPSLGSCSNNSPKPVHECRSRDEFQQALTDTLSHWRGTDQLIFYFTGHGKVINDIYCIQVGPSEKDLLPFDNLLRDLKINGVRRAILILDTCYSGAAAKIKASQQLPSLEQYTLPKGIAILASSRSTETSLEMPDGSSSVFTRLFCEGIEEGLDGKKTSDGYITIEDLVGFVKGRLESDEQYTSFLQRPVYRVDEADRAIWISKNPSGASLSNKGTSNPHFVQSIEDLQFLYEKTLPDKHPCANASLNDLNWDLVEEFLEKTYPEASRSQPKEEVLEALKLFSPIPYQGKPALHKSAVLCFAHKPELFYEQAKSMFVIGNPGDVNLIREEITGPLSRQVIQLFERVKNNLKSISHIAEDGRRQERTEIELNVVRELISNAVTHRDYNINGVVTVTLTDTALEIRSPGGFPRDTSWDAFLNSKRPASCPVNVAISHYQSRLLVFEGIGRGFDVFKKYLKENGEDSITCEILPGSITLVRILRRNIQKPPQDISGIQVSGDIVGRDIHIYTYPDQLPIYQPPPLPDQNTLPSHGPLPPGSYIPFATNPFFVGRVEELLAIANNLLYQPAKNVTVATTTIAGLGGIGKTQIATEFVHRYGRFFAGGVFWLSFADPNLIPVEIARCGGSNALALRPDFDSLPLEEQIKLVQRAWQEDIPRLLVFDNCEDENLFTKWRPLTGGCKIIITTRRVGWTRSLGVQSISLEILNHTDSLALLNSFVPELDKNQAAAIASELGYLPLALHLAGSFLARYNKSVTPEEYLAQLKELSLEHSSLQGRGETYSPTAHESHIERTFALSYEKLDINNEIDQIALLILERAACFAPGEPIPQSLLFKTLAQVEDNGS